MSFLLDANVVSELRKGVRAAPSVRRWSDTTSRSELYTSVLVFGEIRRGIELKRRRDTAQAEALFRWMERLRRDFGARILPVTEDIADVWGQLGIPDALPTADGLLAATALVHDLTVVTRNVVDFERTGVQILDPFADRSD